MHQDSIARLRPPSHTELEPDSTVLHETGGTAISHQHCTPTLLPHRHRIVAQDLGHPLRMLHCRVQLPPHKACHHTAMCAQGTATPLLPTVNLTLCIAASALAMYGHPGASKLMVFMYCCTCPGRAGSHASTTTPTFCTSRDERATCMIIASEHHCTRPTSRIPLPCSGHIAGTHARQHAAIASSSSATPPLRSCRSVIVYCAAIASTLVSSSCGHPCGHRDHQEHHQHS